MSRTAKQSKILGSDGRPLKMVARRAPARGAYDAARTTDENRKHWANADLLSADAAGSVEVRRTLRSRARYEVANNSYAKGVLLSLADYLVGTGPRLQLRIDGGDAPDASRRVEEAWSDWVDEVQFASKLRTAHMSKIADGEAFMLMRDNPKLSSPVKLDVRLYEADQVATPTATVMNDANVVDGIRFDEWGNPASYLILKRHPGDLSTYWPGATEADEVSADFVLHWYRADRPGLHRGVSEMAAALPLFAVLRRYGMATLSAAETAAQIAMVLQSDSPAAGDDEDAGATPYDLVELEPRMATVLPSGWKLGQMAAEHPTTTFDSFERRILNQILRCLLVPLNIGAGDSSGYNYASGRLDHQSFFKSMAVQQRNLELAVLDRAFSLWLFEASRIDGYLPGLIRQRVVSPRTRVPHEWFWDGAEHVDPLKEANAQATRLANHCTTLAAEYAKRGLDWEQELLQRAKELNRMKELGITMPEPSADRPSEVPTQEEIDDAS